MTTIRSYTRHAHKKNPSIPVLGPKLTEKRDPSAQKPFKPVQIPAWNPHQYGSMSGANQSTEGVVFGKRREITQPSPQDKPSERAKAPNTFVPSRPLKPPSLSGKKIERPSSKKNVFGQQDDDDDDENDEQNAFVKKIPKGKQNIHTGDSKSVNKQLMAYSLQSQLQIKKHEAVAESDPLIYAYDEVYDSMKTSAANSIAAKVDDSSEVSTVTLKKNNFFFTNRWNTNFSYNSLNIWTNYWNLKKLENETDKEL